jgi:23S rRNA (uracil1939-C5)-methyltransferase
MSSSQRQIIPFTIIRMDSLGQGVSKEADKITFIPKTMVGDSGEAEILAERKGVVFARAIRFNKKSPERISSTCPHFDDCPSCHFLHMDYKKEISIKTDTFNHLFRKFQMPDLEIIQAGQRDSYRNRIQLHYDLKSRILGMLDAKQDRLVPIPECLIGLPVIKQEIKRLYLEETWIKEAKGQPIKGHLEIYWNNQELKLTWNRPYAEGGFTQVFAEMNVKLKAILASWIESKKPTHLLDLFAGNGNLSEGLKYFQRLCVDIYSQSMGHEFISQDLYDEKAKKRIFKELKTRNFSPQVLLVDPPRSGIKDLSAWVEEIKPHSLAYVSCDPHTLARDLSQLENYTIVRSFLIDFFPSTFHFESMVFLERQS